MDLSSILSFHQTLFTSEIAIFGILAATLFVFIQIIYGYFSYRHISIIIKSPSLIAYLILSTLTIILTGVVALKLAFSNNASAQFFNSESLAIILLSAFFFSLLLFIVYTFFGVLYL